MAVRIRMKKHGRRHRPYYRICAMDARSPRDGKIIEELGTYDPMVRDPDKRVTMKASRIDYWLGVGAQPTRKVQTLIEKYKGKVPEVRVDKRKTPVIPQRAAVERVRASEVAAASEASAAAEPAASSESSAG